MNSPAEIPFNSFIKIDKNSNQSIYLQLADQFSRAIQLGYLPEGTRLPGTRYFAKLFKLHRNTIVSSFQELEAQGWIKVIPNKGSFVLNLSIQKFQKVNYSTKFHQNSYPRKAGFSFHQSILLDDPYENYTQPLSLTDGTVDYRMVDLKIPAKLYSSILKRKITTQKVNESKNDYLLNNLANYLNLTRGLHISKKNILVAKSSEIILFIVSQIILSENDCVAVSELSYYKSNMIFQNAKAKMITINTDDNGIETNHLRDMCLKNSIRIVYVMPHHHYPTTATLSSERRIELIKLSQEFNFVIIEDDFDFDFHYTNHPNLPLTSTDQNGKVVYLGKFGSYLAPGYRVGFLVAPENFVDEAKKYLSILEQQIDPIIGQVIGEMISEGEIHRFLKKIRKEYKDRYHHFYEKLKNEIPHQYISFNKISGGLAIWIRFLIPINLMKLKNDCGSDGLFIPQIILYQNTKEKSIRIGFSHLNYEEIDKVVDILKHNIEKQLFL